MRGEKQSIFKTYVRPTRFGGMPSIFWTAFPIQALLLISCQSSSWVENDTLGGVEFSVLYTAHTGLNTSWCHEISRKICVKHFEPRYANPPFPHFFLISFFLLCVLLNLTTMSNRVHEITIEYKNPLQVRPNKSANRLENAGKKHKIYFSSVDFFCVALTWNLL